MFMKGYNDRSKTVLRVYAREASEDKYPEGLAYSVHFSLIENGKEEPLHQNYGLLFPRAEIDSQNVIHPRFLGKPRIISFLFHGKESYLITGIDMIREQENSVETLEATGEYWCFSTNDFISFQEWGLLSQEALQEKTGINIEMLRAADRITVSDTLAASMKQVWNPIRFTAITSPDEKGNVMVTYSDGSCHKKKLTTYPRLEFPLARGFGDPVVLLWKDEYYFIATNDNLNDIGLYVRKAHTLDELFAENVQMHLILDRDEGRHLIQTFWAPEFHIIGNDLYILFAVSGEQWGPQCHIMKLKEGGDILKASDWEDPVRIKRADGSWLTDKGITLDMTYVRSGNRDYYVWSYRENIGTPEDSGSMLMVAEFSREHPDRIINDPVCISRPLYGFENVRGTINNEGPYAFYHGGTIYLTYSGGDARGYLYCICLLTAADGEDLCNPEVWQKAKTPVAHFASVSGEYGPGHNSFFQDRNGDWWIAFHGCRFYEEKVISSAIRRVHIDSNGKPRFDLAGEEDLPTHYRNTCV